MPLILFEDVSSQGVREVPLSGIPLLIQLPMNHFWHWFDTLGKQHSIFINFQYHDHVFPNAGWSYPEPFSEYKNIAGYLSFYPSKLDCFINGEKVRPQPGGFYGGWITNEIVGPVKGESKETYL